MRAVCLYNYNDKHQLCHYASFRVNISTYYGHVLKPGLDCGLWTVDCGLWTVDCGLWTVDYGLWTMDCGLCPSFIMSEPEG